LSTALHCALAGRVVIVVERREAGSQAAGLFKSVQADELRTRLARRSIARAVSFADWAGVPLSVARSGSLRIARTAQHREYLAREGADIREAGLAHLVSLSYYRPVGEQFGLWCPEDIYIEEPVSLVDAYLAACRLHGVVVAEHEPVIGIPVTGGRVAGGADGCPGDHGAGGRGCDGWLGAAGRRTGWRCGAGRPSAPPVADHRATAAG
jgi:glycine/D-amino acid oxidase-like deaminating enzyme